MSKKQKDIKEINKELGEPQEMPLAVDLTKIYELPGYLTREIKESYSADRILECLGDA